MTDILEKLDKVRRGVMFVIEAPSGTGKTTVIKKLLEFEIFGFGNHAGTSRGRS